MGCLWVFAKHQGISYVLWMKAQVHGSHLFNVDQIILVTKKVAIKVNVSMGTYISTINLTQRSCCLQKDEVPMKVSIQAESLH